MEDETTDEQLPAMTGTKLKIFKAAIELFSKRGYANVSTRDIASVVGIKPASIYNHFENKDDILGQAYQFFYDTYSENHPEPGDVLGLAYDLPPNEILERLLPPFCEEFYEPLRKVIRIVVRERHNDSRAKAILSTLVSDTERRISVVLTRMRELDLIEPMDIELFISVFVNFSLAALACAINPQSSSFAKWQDGRKLLFTLVKGK